ncbi:MAG TPA: phosphoglycerate kinase [Candidatus Paceibacterota bacterium]|nr:phosphoglycerate kinase [Candidatus Paceibacterota bacterium]
MSKLAFRTIDEVKDLRGKRVVLRADFNVHIEDNKVAEEFRIQKTLPTLKFLVDSGAKVVVISHIDSKEGGTLEPVARYLAPTFPKLRFIADIFSQEAVEEVKNLTEGGVILFENLRNWEGEKANTPSFAAHLASFGDIYVNDGFAVSHREHASVVGVPALLPSYAGFLMRDEVENLSKSFNPPHPFLFVLGGAKFETKLPLIEKFSKIADFLFIGGALANDIFKAKGYFMGDSLVSNIDVSKYALDPKIVLPTDVRTLHKGERFTKLPTEISVNEKIWDAGPKTVPMLQLTIEAASLIIWNGPMGNYESGFIDGTKEMAEAIAASNATTIVGGGDVVAALNSLSMLNKFTFVSTGGAAMLEFLASETLPGIKALDQRPEEEEKPSFFKRLFS